MLAVRFALLLFLGALVGCRAPKDSRHSDLDELAPSSAMDQSEGRTQVPASAATEGPGPAENPGG